MTHCCINCTYYSFSYASNNIRIGYQRYDDDDDDVVELSLHLVIPGAGTELLKPGTDLLKPGTDILKKSDHS